MEKSDEEKNEWIEERVCFLTQDGEIDEKEAQDMAEALYVLYRDNG